MKAAGKISVVMPAYNSQSYIEEAIKSILAQTYKNIELIIVDDFSTDSTPAIVEKYSKIDSRIIAVSNKHEKGVVGARNTGVELSSGEFSAFMDSDDIALPNRFARQIHYLNEHPEVDLCGTWVKTFGRVPGVVWKLPEANEEIRLRMLFNQPLANPTLIWRREKVLLLGCKYDHNFNYAEDYDLLSRLAGKIIMANVPEVLLLYRTHGENVGTIHGQKQQQITKKIQLRELANIGLSPTERDIEIHRSVENGNYPKTSEFLREYSNWLNVIKGAVLLSSMADKKIVDDFFDKKLEEIESNISQNRPVALVPTKVRIKRFVQKTIPSRYHRHLRSCAGYVRSAADRYRRMSTPIIRFLAPQIKLATHVKPKFKIGYAILAYERPDYLEFCLESLFASNIDSYDITFLLQDDGSKDPRVKDIINKERDKKFKIVRYFTAKGPNNAGAAINKALRKLMQIDDFDIIGWGDPDGLYHPDWLKKTMEICLWAKENHNSHILGPFSSFNSSDSDFHGVLGYFDSPFGSYVIKRQMGMLNYFYLKSDLLKLGYFDENPDDETLMTKRFERHRVRNFCTETSYIEHIGQWSVLNQWRPVPVARAVHGLGLVSSGWPETLANFNTLGYYKDVKRSKSIDLKDSSIPLSVVFVATSKDFDTLIPAINAVRENLLHPIEKIYLVAPRDEDALKLAKDQDLTFVDEDHVVKTKKSEIAYRNEEGVDRSGWLFQQLLKYGVGRLVSTDHYLVIDADTILIRPQTFFVEDKPLILHSDEFHKSYFDVSQRLLGFSPVSLLSCVSHHMLFSRSYLAEMLAHIEQRHGVDWELAIRNCVDYSDNSGFSEYETYGQWCITKYSDAIEREYWFNISMPKVHLKNIKLLIQKHCKCLRSISFHSYL